MTTLELEKAAVTNFALKKITGQLIFDYSNYNTCKDSRKLFCGSIGIATRYGLESPGIETRWRRDFPHPSRMTGSFPEVKPPERGLNRSPHIVLRLKKQ
jgi:hypothetical protein